MIPKKSESSAGGWGDGERARETAEILREADSTQALIQRGTDVPAFSDTLETRPKCQCNQIVNLRRGRSVTLGNFQKCHCRCSMTNGIAHCDYLTDAGLKHLQLNTKFARTLKLKLEIYRWLFGKFPKFSQRIMNKNPNKNSLKVLWPFVGKFFLHQPYYWRSRTLIRWKGILK